MKITAEVICSMPENESKLAEIARVSTGKSSIFQPIAYPEQNDLELLRKIYKMRHFSVFEFAVVQVAVECPLFVSSQLLRYRCGSYLQESRRRVEPERIAEPQSSYDHYYNKAFESYQALLEGGETKEQARQVLPVYSPTKFVAQWNLRSLFHIFDERLNLHTQMATRLTVEEIKKAVAEVFPTLVGFWDKEQEGEE